VPDASAPDPDGSRPEPLQRPERVVRPGRRRADTAGRVHRTRASGGRRVRRRTWRRARGLPGTLGLTLLGALLPGSGIWWTGRRLLGAVLLLPTLALLAALASYVAGDPARALDRAVATAVDPALLQRLAGVLVVAVLVWALVVYLTYRQVRPLRRRRAATVAGHVFVLALVAVVGAPFAVAARYATVQADLVETVFADNESATVPRDVTREDPWGGRERVNVLLLGGDGAEGREGTRTDTVILMSTETSTGKTLLFSLPRNLLRAQFPEGSALADLYPEGWGGYGAGTDMLNAIYREVPARHPGVLGESADEGADAIKLAVSGSLGLTVDYYLMVDLAGFRQVVDAIGGITVNVNERVAIQGNTDAGIPPVDWIEPGPDQHLDGFHALWFARGRYGSDDYERMDRQRCAVAAMIDAADPLTLVRRYTDLAAAGRDLVSSDVPQHLLPAFVNLALRMKDAKIRSVVFKTSARFFSGDPDYDFVRETVAKAIDPPRRKRERDDPARPRNTANDCAYAPSDPSAPKPEGETTLAQLAQEPAQDPDQDS